MKLVDCFTFYNELNMLELRLEELYDVVDTFVIVEAVTTYTGNKKELYFQNNRDRFKKYLDKIVHVVVDDMPKSNNAWILERFQRNAIHRGLQRIALKDEDLIIISDLDEIPDTDTLLKFKNEMLDEPISLEMDLYYYNFTCKFANNWLSAKVVPFKYYKNDTQPEKWRHKTFKNVPRGGWHLSYFGTSDFICNKIANFAHQEFNNPTYNTKEFIEDGMNNGTDLYRRQNIKFNKIKLEDNTYLPKNYKMFKIQDI